MGLNISVFSRSHQEIQALHRLKMPNILDLPPEILSDISRALCPHCDNPEMGFKDLDSPQTKASREWLSALSLTCKTLRDIAQPVLYHCPDGRRNLFKLLCILFQNPALATSVKMMQVTHKKAPDRFLASTGGYEIFPGDASDLCYALKKAIAKGEEPESPLRAHSRDEATAKANLELAMAGLMLTKTSNIESLNLNVISGWPFDLYAEESLPQLTRLHVESLNLFQLDELMNIFSEAAPQLCELSAAGVWKTYHLPNHTQLRKLRLYDCLLDKEDLGVIIRAFERLEQLDYAHQHSSSTRVTAPSMSDLSNVFLERKDTLKHLIFACERNAGLSGPADTGFTLKDMHVLETFSWESWDNWDDLDPGRPPNKEARDYLVNLLPQSLRKLTLNLPWQGFADAIEYLGQVTPDRFPVLKHVHLRCSRDDEEMILKSLFSPPGIDISYSRNFEEFRRI